MPEKKTLADYIQLFEADTNNEYKLLSTNIDTVHTKVQVLHLLCNTENVTSYNIFKNGCRCVTCYKKRNKTLADYIQLFETDTNNEYKLLSTDIKTNKQPMLIRHNICNFEYKVSYSNFKQGCRCPKCDVVRQRKTLADYIQLFETDTNNEYKLLSTKTTTNKSKVLVRHNICNTEYSVTYTDFNTGYRCPECSKAIIADKRRKPYNDYIKMIETDTNNEYKLLSTEILTVHSKMEILHLKCNRVFKILYNDFKRKYLPCTLCNKDSLQSRNVLLIKDILNYLNIYFTQEYIFDNCNHIKPLPFDFCVPLIDNTFLLIEYDGELHFKPFNKNSTLQFKNQQLRDNIKNQYCLENDIPLLRIPYTDKNIEETLITFLEEYEDLLKFK